MTISETTNPTMNAGSTSQYCPVSAVSTPAASATPAVIAVFVTTSSIVSGRSPTPARPYPTSAAWASA
jgi:hypothetical protein